MSLGKKVGALADKMFKLTGTAAKKLEDYAAKSAVENDNKNAQKLSELMQKVQKAIDENHDAYIAQVEKNFNELGTQGQEAFGKLKQMYAEMKKRTDTAIDKAEADVKKADEESAQVTDATAENAAATETSDSKKE